MPDTLDLSALFEEAKACDLRSILQTRGYTFQSDGKFRENPIRSERTSSIHVRSDVPSRWHDFGTNEGGDLIDFLQAAEGMTEDAARLEAAQLLGVSSNGRATRGGASLKVHTPKASENGKAAPIEAPIDYSSMIDQAHEALFLGTTAAAHQARAYLKHRGLDLNNGAGVILRAAKVGVIDETVELPDNLTRRTYEGRIVFPYLEADGRALFFNARAAADVDPGDRFRKPAGATQTLSYLQGDLDTSSGYVILTEGELDALSLRTALGADAPILAGGGGEVRHEHIEALAGQIDQVFVLYDFDERGEAFARNAEKALKGLDLATRRLTLPDSAKDANDALREHGADALREHLKRQIDAARRTSDAEYIVTTYLEELAQRFDRPFAAYPTGLEPIDKLLDGGYQEGLHVVGGITGGGKTSFALRLALTNALAGRSVIYASFEQSKHELWNRLARSVTGIPYGALKRGAYQDHDGDHRVDELLRNHEAFGKLRRASEKLIILEAGDALSRQHGEHTIEEIHTIAERIKRDAGAPPLVIVDYLQRVPMPALASRDIRERVAAAAGYLQVAIARGVGSPVVALSSMSREGYGKHVGNVGVEEGLKLLKESGEIEYSSYSVGILYRYPEGAEPPGLAPKEGEEWKPILFDMVKNREGKIGKSTLVWTPSGDTWQAHQERSVRW